MNSVLQARILPAHTRLPLLNSVLQARILPVHVHLPILNCVLPPHILQVCTFVSLGLLVAANPITADSTGRLLPKNTFGKTLCALLRRSKHEEVQHVDDEVLVVRLSPIEERRRAFRKMLDDAGVPYEDIGTHSYRKGSATYVASGSTAAPPIIAICLRAGWKLGGVLNTYLSLESAGDRFVGRVCSLLPQVSKEFCVLPPRFPNTMTTDERQLVDKTMRAMFGEYQKFGKPFAAVLRHCLASLCFHEEWLFNQPAPHPWHTTFLGLQPFVAKELNKLVGPLQYDGDSDLVVGTGIPPWTTLALRVDTLEDVIKLLPQRILEGTGKLLDEKGALAGNITKAELRKAMKEIVHETIASYERSRGRGIPEATVQQVDRLRPQWFRWSDGKYHRLPENFVLTCIGTSEAGAIAKTPFQGFLRWNMTDYSKGICPIRQCQTTDFSDRNQRKRFSDWSILYHAWETLMAEQNLMPLAGQARRNATVDDWRQQFNQIWSIHCTLIKFWHPSEHKRRKMLKRPSSYLTLRISTTLHDLRLVRKSMERYSRFFRTYRGMLRIQRRYKP